MKTRFESLRHAVNALEGRDYALLVLAGFALAMTLTWWLWTQPQRAVLAGSDASLVQAGVERDALAARLAAPPPAPLAASAPDTREQAIRVSWQALPTDDSLLQGLETALASAQALRLRSLVAVPDSASVLETPIGRLRTQAIELRLAGNYSAMRALFAHVSTQRPDLRFEQLSYRAEHPAAEISLQLRAFSREENRP